ncbi:SurA N-terminal domain-containing protein [Tunturiibacter gelidoferens]|uniref:Peptidyl-prolyl cis-trans isomerase SurA n=1 Tax=Tunturiibacter gelidiferens TaxID=3069689 RepID=A0ACC5P250_9BACT|nr:SurA N-terminal domain-containing protein [Edaphobacter lichenicola]MBB5340888.1 peptidyl-prolyl cis-trans isomerase SurA [Edaphobacter lichenicola]
MPNTDVPSLSTDTERTFTTRSFRTVSLPAVLILASCLLPVAGCNRGHSADVVATVNGHAIMQADLDKAYKAQLGDAAQQQQQPSQEQADSLRLNVLRELIDEEIVEQRATKMNLTATNEEVDAKLAEMKAPYTEEQFQQRLKASNQTVDDLKHALRRNLTINKLLNKEINSKITVTDADVANYYNQHKAEFNLLETKYHLATIQVTDQPSPQPGNLQGSKATNDVEAKKKIQALKNRLDSGEDFATIASNWSEQPETAPNGGDMGFVGESQLHSDPSVFTAVMKLKAGQITEILPLLDAQSKRPAGYAIYKLISRDPAGQRDVNDPRVQQAIRQQLRDVRSQLLKSAYLEMVHDQAKVENFFAEQIFKTDAH